MRNQTTYLPESEARTVRVQGSTKSFPQDVALGSHQLTIDEPVSVGGTDTGPSPYDLLLAALGSCTSMTLGMYARNKQRPLESVTVKLLYSKIHAEDCEICETNSGMLDHIERKIELIGDLSQQQRERLLDVANKCPVHRTLTSEIVVQTALVNAG